MITAKGAGALVAAIAIYLLARLSQVGWLYLVDSAIWGALLLSFLMPWFTVALISAHRRVSPLNNTAPNKATPAGRISEGDQVKIDISLKNRLFYPRFFHSIKFDCPLIGPNEDELRFFVAQLPGSGTTHLESTVEAYKRGLHHLGPVAIESSAPFGLFNKRRTLSDSHSVTVLPWVYPLNRLMLVDGQDGRSNKARSSRNGLDLAGSRPYVPGDARRMIHWRNTARAGRPMVKETEDEADQTLHILFDSGDVRGVGKETNFEYAIKLAATVADYALKNRVPVQVWGSHIRGANVAAAGCPQQNKGVTLTWPELLESLAVAVPAGPEAMTEGLNSLPLGANIFVVVSADDDAQTHENLWRTLAWSGKSVVVQLEGFDQQPSGENNGKPLINTSGHVVTCKPGGLTQTLSEIEGLGQTYTPRVSAAPTKSTGPESETLSEVGQQ